MARKKRKLKIIKNNSKYESNISYVKLFAPPIIRSKEATIDKIIKDHASIARFGDGEVTVIFGGWVYFQQQEKELNKRLREILQSEEKNLLIGIPSYYYDDLNQYTDEARVYIAHSRMRDRVRFNKLLKNKSYNVFYDASISRFYMDIKDKSNCHKYIEKMKKIWENRNIILCEGDKSRSGVGNDLYDNAKSLKRILAPSEDAFSKYNEILNAIAQNANKEDLILLALGPTATILAYDLYKMGYQAIDIGLLDIEYEWMLKKSTSKEKIGNKYMGEIGEVNVEEDLDTKYREQIIFQIFA